MFKFRGFRATLNLGSGKKQQDAYEYSFVSENVSMSGAYRSNREEFYGNGSITGERKTITPSMVKLPPSAGEPSLRPAKSTVDINQNLPQNLTKSMPDISMNPRGAQPTEQPKKPDRSKQKQTDKQNAEKQKKIDKENAEKQKKIDKENAEKQKKIEKQNAEKQKQLEKQRAAEQKKREKEAAEEAKRKEKENKKKKSKAPAAPQETPKNIPPPPPMPNMETDAKKTKSTPKTMPNVRDSSISRTSGPPPYNEVPDKLEVTPNERDHGNTSFSKPIENNSSWDLVAQHRQMMRAPATNPTAATKQRKMVMDLNYNANRQPVANSDA